jgi:hypothetical protein
MAFEQISGTQRETAGLAVPVFEIDAAVFDADHSTHVSGLRVLDDHPEFDGVLN